MLFRRPLHVLTISSALTLAASADVVVVDATSPYSSDFAQISDAIAVAANGDTVLVRTGNYSGFTVSGKALAILAEPGATVTIAGTVRIDHVPAGTSLVLSGLHGTGGAPDYLGLYVRDNVGAVRIQDCTFTGAAHSSFTTGDGDGAEGAVVDASSGVSFARCTLTGGQPGYSQNCCDYGYTGGHGLWARGTPVALYDCALVGAQGSWGGWGGFGGNGLQLESFGVFASGTSFTGGDGGTGDDFIWAVGGDGGNGIDAKASAQVRRLDCTAFGGAGGGYWIAGQSGVPGVATTGAGLYFTIPGTARKLAGPALAAEGATVTLSLTGVPGDRVYLPSSLRPTFQYLPALHGIALVAWPMKMTFTPLGIVPATGVLTFQVAADDLVDASGARVRHLQAYVSSSANGTFLSGPLDFTTFECAISGDCNQNGLPDFCDVASGTSQDCDGNGVPDECDLAANLLPDCNGNGVADACDISSGTSSDCNADGVPDECSLDCNQNGIADACDIANGTSLDVNANGVPDECQSASDVYFVSPTGLPLGDGSLASPFDSISKAVGYAIDGNQVVLLDGVYTGAANRDVDFGGRAIIVRGLHGAANTIVDCEAAGRAFVFRSGEPQAAGLTGVTIRGGSADLATTDAKRGGGVIVRDASPTFVNCVFEDCTAPNLGGAVGVAGDAHPRFVNCEFSGNFANQGGAMTVGSFIEPVLATLELEQCSFTENDGFSGAALSFRGTEFSVRDSDFEQNTGGFGAAIHAYSGALRITRSRFVDNVGTSYGALNFSCSSLDMQGCTIAGNSTTPNNGAAAGIYASATGHVRIDDTLFESNRLGAAAALRIDGTPGVSVTNCTFAHNVGDYYGGIYLVSCPNVSMLNCVVWRDDAPSATPPIGLYNTLLRVGYSVIEGGQAGIGTSSGASVIWGAGNSAADPNFVSMLGPDGDPATWADNDLRLAAGSPCIDAGDNASRALDFGDLDGDGDVLEFVPFDLLLAPRTVDDPAQPDTGSGTAPLVDLGAYERQP
ncbi:MAG: right-handed parallel beta-helix repeat-containing protein [Planctomycetes bacterium]|nr:right-handed parallel beta-helix repeat-containing protein [Planctomycetota bacterium]